MDLPDTDPQIISNLIAESSNHQCADTALMKMGFVNNG